MRFNCGDGWLERRCKRERWHRWFAWRPVRVADGDCRWLEYVERQGRFFDYGADFFWEWSYRLPSPTDPG
jgi:hypothetical protein